MRRPLRRTTAPAAAIATLIAPLLLLAGCSKLTVDNYEKLKVGMDYEAVRSLIGDPARCDEVLAVRNCTWGDSQRRIAISFAAGKVVLLSAEGIR